MAISKTTFTILLVSIFVGLLIMMIAFFVTRAKISKYQKTVVAKRLRLGNAKKVFNRKTAGELLWDLRAQALHPLQDSQLEFLINTALRNDFKTFNVIGSSSDYEATTLIKIARLKKDASNPDLVVIFNNVVFDQFDQTYRKLQAKQMIVIVNARKRDQVTKRFLKQLKDAHIRHDYVFIGLGLILVVK